MTGLTKMQDNDSSPLAADAATVTERPPEPESTAAVEAPIPPENGVIVSLTEEVRALRGLVAESNRLSEDRERIVDRLHEQNQALKQGELDQAMAPVFRDLIRLFDDLSRTTQAYVDAPTLDIVAVRSDLACYRDTITDILERHGVERYDASVGEAFDGKQHRALAPVATTDAAKDRCIARVVRPGFRNERRILRTLEAEVHRYAPAPPKEPAEPASAANAPAEDAK